ncbi:MAG: anti-sigma factor antagonist [Bacteroides sp.]|nr:anti-sigma factor antagonist [Eubacterium sp.]MCM1418421.1 anti-sigma factor antagonist [Roseburia sp.]MCM1461557.1 anti-sigma factor antagonist [Bacteroides sp.]
MAVEIINDGERLLARLSGEIDHHSAAQMRFSIDGELDRAVPRLLILDFSGVDFMDSSGIGLILGRLKRISGWGGRLAVANPKPPVKKMIALAGLERLIQK